VTEARCDWRGGDRGARYLVLASLPHMPCFDRARRLPIGRETLAARLALLPVGDVDEVALATSFLSWQRHPAERSDDDVLHAYDRVMTSARTEGLKHLVAFRLGLRTLVAALRRRRLGHPAPRPGQRWGVGPWTAHIQRRYGDADFGLEHVLPWLPGVRRLLDDGDAIGLERLLFRLVWRELDVLTARDRFGFDAVLAYAFKWDLVDRWLRHDADAAARRADLLALQALGDFAQPFAAAR
jgi:hypothetical protein